MPTIESLKHRIERCENALNKEQQRQLDVLNRQGWGYGMRHSKIGVSSRREQELKARLEKLKTELRELEKP